MISASDRRNAMVLIKEAVASGAREAVACGELGITANPATLEKQINLKYKSLPPSQIVPRLADQGIYLASESTFYRVLKKNDMQHHRGRVKKSYSKPISTHYATGPNQVWMWDITWLPGPAKGIYFYLYLILDLFSRKIIAWDIWSQ